MVSRGRGRPRFHTCHQRVYIEEISGLADLATATQIHLGQQLRPIWQLNHQEPEIYGSPNPPLDYGETATGQPRRCILRPIDGLHLQGVRPWLSLGGSKISSGLHEELNKVTYPIILILLEEPGCCIITPFEKHLNPQRVLVPGSMAPAFLGWVLGAFVAKRRTISSLTGQC